MRSLEIIKKFIRSNALFDQAVRDLISIVPVGLRNRLYYGKAFVHWAAFLRESEYWDRERLNVFQLEQLKDLLSHAARYVPYYRNLFAEHGFHPPAMQSLDDFKILPCLTKDAVRDCGADLLAEDVPRKALIRTAAVGSAGIPLVIYKTRKSKAIEHAFLLHLLNRVGYRQEMKSAMFQFGPLTRGQQETTFLRNGNKLLLSAAGVTDTHTCHIYYKMLTAFRPAFLSGFKTILLSFALFIKTEGMKPLAGVKAILVYGEMLTPRQREMIGESFGARVFSVYGMQENVAFGGECEYSSKTHIYPQLGITEFLDQGNACREIVGTGFSNYAMPFVRYRTMDLCTTVEHGCSGCRRDFPLIGEIYGRMNEYLVTQDGNILNTYMSNVDPDIFRNVKQFQFYQEEPGVVYMRIVKGPAYTEADTQMIMREADKRFRVSDNLIRLFAVFVDSIEKTPSGKTAMTDQRLDVNNWED